MPPLSSGVATAGDEANAGVGAAGVAHIQFRGFAAVAGLWTSLVKGPRLSQ